MIRRTRHSVRAGNVVSVLAVLLLWPTDAYSDYRVSGRVVYGTINENPERRFEFDGDDDGERASIFDRGLAEGEPIPFVQVELGSQETITDKDGNFEVVVSNKRKELTVRARNDYVQVKESKNVPLIADRAISVDFDLGNPYDGEEVDLGDIEINDTDHTFHTHGEDYPVSRALYICGVVQRGAWHIEELLTGESVGDVDVRLGYGNTAWYDKWLAINRTIHLPATDAAIMAHEYGHLLEDDLGAFGVIPSYIFQGGHTACGEQSLLNGDPGYCWAFLEGLASWYGAVNAYGFTSVSGVDFFDDPPDNDGDGNPDWDRDAAMLSLGDNWWVETGPCLLDEDQDGVADDENGDGSPDQVSWSEPAAVESVVAHVLWDLVDSNQDGDLMDTGIPEIAEIPIEDVLEVLTTNIGTSSPCGWAQSYKYPVTLDQFCVLYRGLHAGDTEHGVVPDLFAAFAFNGVDTDCAEDTEAPDAVTVESTTHPAGEWHNSNTVFLRIEDGYDDISGSYYYFEFWDGNTSTELTEADTAIGTEDLASKDTTNLVSHIRAEGDNQWYHVQTRDLAGHLGTTQDYGPIRIDTTSPVWGPTDFPGAGDVYPIGGYVYFEWESYDALSGVDHVEIIYDDATNGIHINYPKIYEAVYSYDLYVDPDDYLPTTTGRFTVILRDRAGNSIGSDPDDVTIVAPFDGPFTFDFDLADGRAVSGDLNGNGTDDIVLSGLQGTLRILRAIELFPTSSVQVLTPGMRGGDLFLADVDRDDDLDLVAGGDFGGAAPEIRLFVNDGSGGLTLVGTLPTPGLREMRLRVVDLFGNGQPILVYMGVRPVGPPLPELRTFDLQTGTPLGAPVGVTGVLGDFELGDVNADGYFDFVMLGTEGSGVSTLTLFDGHAIGTGGPWTSSVIAAFPSLLGVDVDLGNWDSDRDLDLFSMQESTFGTARRNITGLQEWQSSSFIPVATAPAGSRVSGGDGHIVDIYNDGLPDVLALGRLPPPGGVSSWLEIHHALGNRGSGAPVPISDHPLYRTDTAWGDFDGDEDLDFVVSGLDPAGAPSTVWYQNQTTDNGAPNSAPPTPVNLSSEYDLTGGGYVFSWEAPGLDTDETAELAFGYELRVGSTPGASDIVTWAHLAGPSQQAGAVLYSDHYQHFVPLALGTFYWSVRAVDSSWERSAPAAEQATSSLTPAPCSSYPGDCDADGIADACESDTDGDGSIDDCDADDDNDGVADGSDPSPLDPYVCGDSDGDACDDCSNGVDGFGILSDVLPDSDGLDRDHDGVCDAGDPCPDDNPDDSDGDGVCDSSDQCAGWDDLVDTDLDGVPDGCDSCPVDNPDDSDGDGICDFADLCPGADDTADRDGDGVPDACDPCPDDAADDSDGDGSCDSDDLCAGADDTVDTDEDGVPDDCDSCPADDPNDSDRDGVCDADDICEGGDDYADRDSDGVPNACDNCPSAPNPGQADSDGDGVGDACTGPPTHHFRSGTNLVSVPSEDGEPNTAYRLLLRLGDPERVEAVMKWDRDRGEFLTAEWVDGILVGDDFAIEPGDGVQVIAAVDFDVALDGELECVQPAIRAGMNLVSFPCPEGDMTAFSLLQDIEEPVVLVSRRDPSSGELQEARRQGDVLTGVDFPIRPEEAYFIEIGTAPPPVFRRGDADANGAIDIGDVLRSLFALFVSSELAPPCLDAADVNDDGDFSTADALDLLYYLFLEGEPPRTPGPVQCGPDETVDDLADCVYERC